MSFLYILFEVVQYLFFGVGTIISGMLFVATITNSSSFVKEYGMKNFGKGFLVVFLIMTIFLSALIWKLSKVLMLIL